MTHRSAAAASLRLLIALLALALSAPTAPSWAAQSLTPREAQRLLREATQALDSARALLARGEQKGAKERLSEAEANYRKILGASPEEKEAALGLSSVLFLTRRHEDGIRLMAPLYERDASDHDVAHQLGLHLYRAGHAASALPLLEAVANDPGRFDAAWLLAVHYYREARWEAGLRFAERYVAARPDDLRALGLLGTYYLKNGRLAEAVTALDRYLGAFPDQLAARINRANALFRKGDLARAASEYEALVAADPERSRLIYNLAAVRIKQGDCDAALPLLDRFIAKEGQGGTARYFRADCLLRLGRLEEAQGAFREALAGAENNPWVFHGLSRIARAQSHLDEAVSQARRAAALAPDEVELLAWLGTLLRLTGAPQEALGWHDKALARAPERADLHVERGRDAWASGRLDLAGDAFRRAVALAPTLPAATTGLAAVRTTLALRARDAGGVDTARQELVTAVRDAPDYGPARVNLALVLLQLGRPADAERTLDGAPEAARDGDHAATLALARLHRGDTPGAQSALQQARTLKTHLGAVVSEVDGFVAAQGGDWEAAARALDAAHDAAPRDELDRARTQAWFEVGLDRLGRGDEPGARAALAKVAPRRGALPSDDRATLDFANAALAVLGGDAPERAAQALLSLVRGPAYRGPRFATAREAGALYAAYAYLRANAPDKALKLLDGVRGDSAPAAATMARFARDLLARRAYGRRAYAEAAKGWRELLERPPDDPATRSNLAAALFASGQPAEATRIWRALFDAGSPPEATYNLAIVADREGDYRRGWELLRRYLQSGAADLDPIRERVRDKERIFGFTKDGGPP